MLCISGVSAEEIDVDSSVVADCPVSAELDNSLSSNDASYNELSNYESYDASDCEGFKHSSEPLDSSNQVSYESSDSFDSYGQMSYESYDLPESYNHCIYVGSSDCCDLQSCESLDLDDFGAIDNHDSIVCESFDDVYCIGEIAPILGVVDDNVIVDDCNICPEIDDVAIPPTIGLDEILKSKLESLTGYDELGVDPNSKISEVTGDREASLSNNFSIDVNPQVNDLLRFENECDVLDIYALDLQEISETSEPVFDTLMTSGYVSYKEAYFGTISDSDREMLLKYIGADDLILFASSAIEWNSGVAFDILKNVTLNQQIDEINLAGYKITKALLKYCPLTGEIGLYFVSERDNEDEQGHVINDTNSHGLDYAYVKHVNVIYKDMPNLMVLTFYGCASIEETAESWDGLNDVLGYSVSSETLLPDHKAIWTPLLLLLQQDLQESIVNSHADDNRNKTISKAKTNDTNNTNCSNKTHHKGWIHHCKHGRHNNNGYTPYYYGGYTPSYDAYTSSVAVNSTDLNKKKHDNSTDDKNKSSNVTATSKKGKSSEIPKAAKPDSEPTYTLVYAILGIVFVSVLFNSGYMKRND
ncbi:hypothetical protein [uncultured Methanobrevibacter sp.]|uniref:hypothetical protein n=1 Tax=uncultured Methanobrevibacter sp. TaxID=253161 RepID=UPI00263498B7|nr:hypothetical protein [uncultured Methanobrevibacter sp.]